LNILVRNLSRGVTEKDLFQLFLPFGRIKSLNIVTDQSTGQSKGFGFVDMPEDSEAGAAIKALDGKRVRGQKVRVKKTVKQNHIPSQNNPDTALPERFKARETKNVSTRKDSGKPRRLTGGR
jgi:RNA recognition motif-containing protein